MQTKAISASLRVKWAVTILALLLCGNITGCSSASRKIEAWKIDPSDATLYRRVGDDLEQAMPILHNPSMHRFLCSDIEDIGEGILIDKTHDRS